MKNRARRVGIPVVVAAAILVGLAAAKIIPIASPNSSATPSSADASASVDASSAPSISPTPSPTRQPSHGQQYAACATLDETAPLALRVEHISHTGRDWVISAYQDGHVLTPDLRPGDVDDGAWMLSRRLTPHGIAQLREAVMATGLFGVSGSYGAIPLPNVQPPGRGGDGYSIAVESGAAAVTVNWLSMFSDDGLYYEPSPEREALDELGANLIVFDSWLGDDGWAERDPCTVQALRFRVFVDPQTWGGALADIPPEIAGVPWPLGGEALSWGADIGYQPPNEPYDVERCGIVARADASRLVDELREAGAVDRWDFSTTLDAGPYIELDLGYRAANQVVHILVQPLLPDDDECLSRNHPHGGGI